MPTNTLFNPRQSEEFNSSVLNYNGYGVTEVVSGNTTTNLDLTFADDLIVSAIELIIDDPKAGDYMTLQVVHPTGTVLNTFVPKWIMGISSFRSFYKVGYPAKLFAGLILRASYVSVNSTPPTFVAVNYALHKVLF
jgi:hypothetical protein